MGFIEDTKTFFFNITTVIFGKILNWYKIHLSWMKKKNKKTFWLKKSFSLFNVVPLRIPIGDKITNWWFNSKSPICCYIAHGVGHTRRWNHVIQGDRSTRSLTFYWIQHYTCITWSKWPQCNYLFENLFRLFR